MNETHVHAISETTGIEVERIVAAEKLLDNGDTIPFIARYRKEATGSLDEVELTSIRDQFERLREIDARRESILTSLEKNGHLTDELKTRVQKADSLAALEDIYLPYKPKRRTRAAMAREKGLEPLALSLFSQTGADPEKEASAFIDPEKGVDSIVEALDGARDIIAEMINEDEHSRKEIRKLFFEKGRFTCRVISGKEESGKKYRDYFEWEEPAVSAPSHRVLAMRRGEKEEILSLVVAPPEEDALEILENCFIKGDGADSRLVKDACRDSYKRLLSRSMETELRLATKEKADIEAIRIFSGNLRELLLAPPLGPARVLGVDPGFRTGCKVVCLDRQGKLLHHETIFPHTGSAGEKKAEETVEKLCREFNIEAIAVGNGTAGRETEAFFRNIPALKRIPIVMINESGASIYSASEVAREEFPDLDLTYRGAVSIGRRLMDPLAELVKIDPKAIGVGQYQHDVDQKMLKQALDDVVMSCVNSVGVDLNRAGVQLLSYVAGIGNRLAKNIVEYRNKNGAFSSRKELLLVKRLGKRAFQQAAGFLRIPDGENPLDASAVHPESYHIVDAMAKDLGLSPREMIGRNDLKQTIDIRKYITDTVGVPTLNDILDELARPGRDPRKSFEVFSFAEGIDTIEDLFPGLSLPGVVTNVTAFGAFVDIGVHRDGLVHISELKDGFVKNPSDVVKVGDKVMVTVIDVENERERISLSMKKKRAGNEPVPSEKSVGKKKDLRSSRKGEPFHNPFAELLGKS